MRPFVLILLNILSLSVGHAQMGPCVGALKVAVQDTSTGDLFDAEIQQIQNAAEILGHDIYVLGSAAKSKRRHIGSSLPLAAFGQSKEGTKSDIDYVVSLEHEDEANKLKLPDIDPGFGVRGVNYINLRSSPAIRFSPGKAPEYIPMQDTKIILYKE